MQVTLDIPEALAAQLSAAGIEPARAALESLAVEGYRLGRLSEADVGMTLALPTRAQVHALLAAHDVPVRYTERHLRLDIEASDKLHRQREEALAQTA